MYNSSPHETTRCKKENIRVKRPPGVPWQLLEHLGKYIYKGLSRDIGYKKHSERKSLSVTNLTIISVNELHDYVVFGGIHSRYLWDINSKSIKRLLAKITLALLVGNVVLANRLENLGLLRSIML